MQDRGVCSPRYPCGSSCMTTCPELRKKYKKHYEKFAKLAEEYDRLVDKWNEDAEKTKWCEPLPPYPPLPVFEPLPVEIHDMTCGAKTRAGTPCKRTDIWRNGRCKYHGGMSTGPTTIEGKKKASQNWRKKRSPCTVK